MPRMIKESLFNDPVLNANLNSPYIENAPKKLDTLWGHFFVFKSRADYKSGECRGLFPTTT